MAAICKQKSGEEVYGGCISKLTMRRATANLGHILYNKIREGGEGNEGKSWSYIGRYGTADKGFS